MMNASANESSPFPGSPMSHSAQNAIHNSFPGKPTGVVAPHGAATFEISWPDGNTHHIPNSILRGFCPCAGCQGHGGEVRYQEGRNSELRDILPVGNYALGFVWGDSHDSGIYSFEYLFTLGVLNARLGSEGLVELQVLPRGQVVAAGASSAE